MLATLLITSTDVGLSRGDASITPDGSKLVVSNMRSGFDIYDAATGTSLATLTHTVDQIRTVPVRFIHGGNVILGGSTVGLANLWDVATCRKQQSLVIGGTPLRGLVW